MAKLPDLIEQNQKKLKSTQQLAGEAGLPTPPITAVGTGTLGGTPQQQAMAGTPAQKKSVLEAVTKVARPGGETQLEQAKLLRAPAVETETDQASKARVQQLVQGLGTFGAKAVELIDSAKQSVFGKPAAASPTTAAPAGVTLEVVTPDNLKDQPIEKQNKIKTLVSDIARETDPTKRNELIRDLNVELGKSPDSPMSAAEMDKFYADVTETVGKQTEEKVRRAIAGEDEILNIEDFKNLGTSVEELATLFNMAPADVLKLTVTDLQNRLAGLDVGTGEVQATTAGMTSGLLSTAERQALRGNLAQLEERGLAGAAVQYKSLLDDIDRGTTVSIGGQQYGIDELLADGTFSGIAEQYFANPNSDWAKNLAKSEPGLVQWLTGNEKVLNDLISSSKTSVTEFGKLQTDVAKMVKGLRPDVVTKLTKGKLDPTKFQTSAIDPKSLPPAVQRIASITDAGRQTDYANNINELVSVMGEDYVSGLTDKQLDAMRLDDRNGPGSQWMTAIRTMQSALNSPNRETKLDAVTDGTIDWDNIDAQLAEDNFRIAMGLPPSELSQMDSNKDGKLTEQELNAYAASVKVPSFDEYNSGTRQSITRLSSKGKPGDSNAEAIFDTLKDGTVSPDEQKVLAGIPTDSLQEFLDKLMSSGKATRGTAGTLASIVGQKMTQDAAVALGRPLDDVINEINSYGYVSSSEYASDRMAIAQARASGVEDKLAALQRSLDAAIQRAPSKAAASQLQYNKSVVDALLANVRDSFAKFIAGTTAPPPRTTAYNPETNRETFEGF